MLQIIISPAKKMNIVDSMDLSPTPPTFLSQTKEIHTHLLNMTEEELKTLWKCSDKLTEQNYIRLHTYNLEQNVTPALLSYEGIQYQTMAPQVFSESQWEYVNTHLNILSGFYGVLRPTDGVIPYRLEMQAKLKLNTTKDLYEYWGDTLYKQLRQNLSNKKEIINLASAEYSKAILPYLEPDISCITCVLGEINDQKVKVKATQAKIARGEMVRWMAEKQIEKSEDVKNFCSLDYEFCEDLSSEKEYVFIKKGHSELKSGT